MSILMPVLITLHIGVCLVMIVAVLMQRPRSEGLGAAFGGGVTDNIFGAQTTQVLGRFTTWLAGIFFALTLLLSILTAKSSGTNTPVQQMLLNAPVPQASAAPAAPAASASPSPAGPAASPAASPK